MCKTLREQQLKQIANDSNNNILLNNIIIFINKNLNIDLIKEYNSLNVVKYRDIINIDSNDEFTSEKIKKIKAFYKQTVRRVLNLIERQAMKERLLLEDIEKGQRILNMKKSATVQSPNYGSEVGKQENGYHPNSQEKILIAIGEEMQKQEKKIAKYDEFSKEFEEQKSLIQQFIELSPNTTGVEATIRHYIMHEKHKSIEDKLCHSNVRTSIGRLTADLGMILMYAL